MAVEMPRLMVKLWLHHLLAVWLWAGPLASLKLNFLGCKMGSRSTQPVAGWQGLRGSLVVPMRRFARVAVWLSIIPAR